MLAQKEREAKEHQRIQQQQEIARQKAAETARLRILYEEHVRRGKEGMKGRLEQGERVFLYDSLYVTVDSELFDKPLGIFNLTELRILGLQGWEVIGIIPRTVGVVTQNSSIGSTIGTTWGGGAGGNVAGVHVLLRKEVKLEMLKEGMDDEIAAYIMRCLPRP